MGLSYSLDVLWTRRAGNQRLRPALSRLRRRIGACAVQLLAKNLKERKASRPLNTEIPRFFRTFSLN
jgi:hypothetical protein